MATNLYEHVAESIIDGSLDLASDTLKRSLLVVCRLP